MIRRTFLRAVGAGGVAGLAGCTGGGGGGDDSTGTDTSTPDGNGGTAAATTTGATAAPTPELVVSTYGAFVDAPSTSPGPWIKETFESEFDATLRFATPDSEINYYVERAGRNVDIDADVYVGLDTDALIRVDEKLSEELFVPAELSNAGTVKPGLQFDPQGRAIPFDTGYVSLVYDETHGAYGDFAAPETFEGLLASDYEGDLLAQNPTSSTTGRSFLLHTIKRFGEDGYLDYWADLQDNGVRVLDEWSSSYTAYSEGEAPMVVSYSTDQVYASRSDEDLARHQIRFLNDQGYANPEGMAIFEDADDPELARSFLEFMLRPDVQGEIAQRNVAFPATSTADLPESFATYAKEPPEGVTFTYDALRDGLSTWTEAWARQFASK